MELCFLLKNGCDDIPGMGCMSEGVGKSDRFACFKTVAKATESTTPSGQTELVGSIPEIFTMAIEPHTPTNVKRPCGECVLSAGSFMCMDRAYCRARETGKTWKKKV